MAFLVSFSRGKSTRPLVSTGMLTVSDSFIKKPDAENAERPTSNAQRRRQRRQENPYSRFGVRRWAFGVFFSSLANSLRYHFGRGLHALRGGVVVDDGGAAARDVSGEGAAFEDAFQNFLHPEGETVGLGDAFDLGFAIAGPKNRGELAEAVDALVVHLDDDDPFEFRPDFLEGVRQGVEMAEMNGANLVAVLARQLHGVVDRAVGGTPADKKGVAFLVAINFRDLNFVGEFAEFVPALGGHGHVKLRAARRVARLVVLEAGQ